MNIRTLTLVLGSALTVAAGGIGATACSSSSSGGNGGSSSGGSHNDGGGSDGTASSSGSTSSSGSSSGSTSSSGGGDDGGGSSSGSCKSPSLHPPVDGGGLYCPFSFNDATDSGVVYCTQPGQMCCVSPSTEAGISDCENVGANCTTNGYTPWQCSAPSDCNGITPITIDGGASSGPVVCCLTAGALVADTSSGICANVQKTKGNAGNVCMYAADCVPGTTVTEGTFTDTRMVACESDPDCANITGNTHCTAVYTIGTQIGVCSQ
ncbi:MAG TPA: hypothetical protein VGG39_38205 [Polyangiaceae bacterium]|jgi:hypothetical protein